MNPAAYAHSSFAAPRLSTTGLVIVAVLHLGILWGLLRMEIIPVPLALKTLTVALIRPPEEIKPPEPPVPQAEPVAPMPSPRPKPVQRAAPEKSPVPPSSPAVAPPPSEVAPLAPMTSTAPPAPAKMAPARFDADYLDNPKPVYPPLSRRMGEEGRVVLRVHVEASGRPSEVQWHSGSGSARLDQAAADAVRRWRFVPAKRGDEAVAAWVLVPIVFSLKE